MLIAGWAALTAAAEGCAPSRPRGYHMVVIVRASDARINSVADLSPVFPTAGFAYYYALDPSRPTAWSSPASRPSTKKLSAPPRRGGE